MYRKGKHLIPNCIQLTPCYVQSTIQSSAPGVLELLLLLIVAQVVAFGAQSKVAPLLLVDQDFKPNKFLFEVQELAFVAHKQN